MCAFASIPPSSCSVFSPPYRSNLELFIPRALTALKFGIVALLVFITLISLTLWIIRDLRETDKSFFAGSALLCKNFPDEMFFYRKRILKIALNAGEFVRLMAKNRIVLFMTNISYMRAGASCLPLVGPFVGLYNALEVKNELSSRHLSLSNLRYTITGVQKTLAALTGTQEGVDKSAQEQERQRAELKNKCLSASQKGCLYAICGIVGNVLSIATLVGLVALGILSVVPEVVVAPASFTFQAVFLSYILHQHNENIQALQTA